MRGTQLGMGWHDDRWAFDLGHTPQEFTVSNWVGGVTYNGDWSSLDYRLTASRRPLTNSLVSYAGAVDPVTGTQWGGVTANGFTLGLSHDRGAKDGVWASLSSHWLVGQNVENNQRRTAMGGYYYRLVERADERLRTGLTLMYMGFDKDLSEDTLGQGGYYSPQQYYSVSVPVNYAWRNADWSALLESSVGWSFAKIDGSDFYPKDNREADLQSLLAQSNKTLVDNPSLTKSGSSSNGYNLRVQGLVERRLSDNLVLGAGITWQHSEGYAPSRALLYLRYTFDPWQGNLPLPVEPISPYADMR
ncbi:Cellulose synthase operon protein C precursor [compost metagenome]